MLRAKEFVAKTLPSFQIYYYICKKKHDHIFQL